MTSVLIKEEKGGGSDVKLEADIEVTHLHANQSQGLLATTRNEERGKEQIFPQLLQKNQSC